MIEMCKHYRTTGWPLMSPVCIKGYIAGLKCHSYRWTCPDYFPSSSEYKPKEDSK